MARFRIGTSLSLAFGALFLIIAFIVVLNLVVSREASHDYDMLHSKVAPVIDMLDKFQSTNRELTLLLANKLSDANDEVTNRLKGVLEVEFPNFKTECALLAQLDEQNQENRFLLEEIAARTGIIVEIGMRLTQVLETRSDYSDESKIKASKQLFDSASKYTFEHQNDILRLAMNYRSEYESVQANLTTNLNRMSQVSLAAGGLGILFGLVIAVRTRRRVLRPIQRLDRFASEVTEGRYDIQLSIEGNDEMSSLQAAFNEMTASLELSFTKITAQNKELEQFAYVASHDLQEPLRTLTSFAQLLEASAKDKLDDAERQSLDYIQAAAGRMSQLIRGLLDYANLGTRDRQEKVDLGQLVQTIQADLGLMIQESQAEVDVGPLPRISANREEMRVLLQNLMGNAIKFRRPDVNPKISIRAKQDARWLYLTVEDNGIGIDPKHAQRIFLMFSRLNSRQQFAGNGIGLAHCQKIVTAHGGSISALPADDHGSIFRIQLPLHIVLRS